jgi:hypothetical protein
MFSIISTILMRWWTKNNYWFVLTFALMTVVSKFDNQPDNCEEKTMFEKLIKWWKHRKRKIPKRLTTKRSGYYVYGNKEEMARICYLSGKGMQRVREYSKRLSCEASTYVPPVYEENKYIGIDTLSTYCMTNSLEDFIETPRSTNQSVTGISDSSARITKIGKGHFYILDDLGMKCELVIPELYYCRTAPYRIISPQHLDKMWRESQMGWFEEATNSQYTIIRWEDEYGDTHVKTIKHTTTSGVPVCPTAPDYTRYKKLLREHETGMDERELISLVSTMPLQGYEQPKVYNLSVLPNQEEEYQLLREYDEVKEKLKELREDAIMLDFHDDNLQKSSDNKVNEDSDKDITHEDNDEFSELSAKTEKLMWHYKLGHTPFSAINRMAMNGELPKRLATAPDPTCASCMYGQSTKRPWRTKSPATQVGERTKIMRAGDCVSIDQMESPVPGLVAHMKGHPTKERYNCARVFVDHYSDISFVHLQNH